METRKLIVVLLSALGISFLVPPELQSQSILLGIRKEDSHIGFSIYKWAVFKEEGRFKDFDGVIEFDPAHLEATKVDITINASSVDSRNQDRDSALRSQDFFNVTRYPNLRFKSVSAKKIDNANLLVEGDINMRGVTKRITVPVKVLGVNRTGTNLGTLVGFESTFNVNREEFGIAEGWEIISKEATIHLLIGAGSAVSTAIR